MRNVATDGSLLYVLNQSSVARESNDFQYPKPTTDECITAERKQTAAWF
jgi:hypothetical protein